MANKLRQSASPLMPSALRCLLHQASRSGALRCPRSERGFSFAAALLVSLAVVLGSVAVVNRTTAGRLASAFQVSNREAREIAEAGIVEIVSELNKERNRKLLVSGQTPSGWDEEDAALVNPCTGFDSVGAIQATSVPTDTAIDFGTKAVTSGRRQFQLENITYSLTPPPLVSGETPQPRQAFSSATPEALVSGITKSQMKITVVGRVLDAAGNGTSEARVTREFEVAPKCCKRSFGRNRSGGTTYGTDRRSCFSTPGGAGLLLSLNGAPVSKPTGAKFEVEDENGDVLPTVFCRADSPECPIGSTELGIGPSLTIDPKLFGAILPPPLPPALSTLPVGIIKDARYIKINRDIVPDGAIQTCNASLSSCTTASFCGATAGADGSVNYYCKVSEIDLGSNDLLVDTSNGSVFFYFENPEAPGSKKEADHQYIKVSGSRLLSQVYCLRCIVPVAKQEATPAQPWQMWRRPIG